MRVLVCGGRKFSDRPRLYATLHVLLDDFPYDTVISGMAPGADILAADWATENGYQLQKFPADWGKQGNAAGPIRNQQMIDEGQPDLVIAFPGGKGTADMVRRAKKANIKVIEV